MRLLVFILVSSSILATCKKVAVATLDASKSQNYKTLEWKQISGSQSQIEDSSKVITRMAFDVAGINYVRLIVKDSTGKSDTAIKKITVIK